MICIMCYLETVAINIKLPYWLHGENGEISMNKSLAQRKVKIWTEMVTHFRREMIDLSYDDSIALDVYDPELGLCPRIHRAVCIQGQIKNAKAMLHKYQNLLHE